MSIEVNQAGFELAKRLIADGNVVDTRERDWGHVNPATQSQDDYIAAHGIYAWGEWHLGIDPDADPSRKEAYSFPFGDYHNLYRSALIAAEERATQYGHTEIHTAAQELLAMLPEPR